MHTLYSVLTSNLLYPFAALGTLSSVYFSTRYSVTPLNLLSKDPFGENEEFNLFTIKSHMHVLDFDNVERFGDIRFLEASPLRAF